MKNFKDLVQSLDEAKFKLPRGEQEVDSYMEKGAKGSTPIRNSLCALGLNDVLYIVPEYDIEEYDQAYRT